MNEGTKILDSIRKDWGLIPNSLKIFIVFSAFGSWYVGNAWTTNKSRDIYYLIVLCSSLILLIISTSLKSWWLRRKYSLSGFLCEDYELLNSDNIWFLIDHKRKQIRWIANMATFVELGFRHPPEISGFSKRNETLKYLKENKFKGYKACRYILIMGRRGEGIKEE